MGCRHLTARRRHRHHEHHAGQRHRTHVRDWLRQALGARASTVFMQFLIEAIILSLAGGLVGVISV
ncbi:MAG: hypothetical protein IPN96_18050 [Anaerolineales bacterium]|nr:hypothetical protein [Anaerolineales bacterium]